MKICLVRHGETAWSLTGQHTGVTDLALTPAGEAESCALAPRLQGMGFARVLVSPSLRARQTCKLAGLGASSQIDPDLAEWDYGRYECKTSAQISNENPQWNIWQDGCPGGESPADVSARADRFIARACAVQGSVAVFSHGHFSAALAVRWIGLALAQGQHFALDTASVSMLGVAVHHPDQRTIELWNERPSPTAS